MRPIVDWDVPALRTSREVAEWFGITLGELDWFADVQGRNPKQTNPQLQHYVNRWVPKRGDKYRLLEVPKYRLKIIQRKVLHEIVDRIPAHDAAHGFRVGRSIRTFAQPHVGKAVVWRLDLKDFFPSIPASRVHALFRIAGYPLRVARTLTGLCTTRLRHGVQAPNQSSVPSVFWDRHLPQGAPTSPALANLCAYRLDVRYPPLPRSAASTTRAMRMTWRSLATRDLRARAIVFVELCFRSSSKKDFGRILPRADG